MMQRTFAYVCAPTTHSADYTPSKLKDYCKALYDLGFLPVCPSLMFSRFLSNSIPEQREDKRAMSLALLRRCRVVVVCSDEVTEDMEAEIMLAKRLGIVATTLAGIRKISLHTEKGDETE